MYLYDCAQGSLGRTEQLSAEGSILAMFKKSKENVENEEENLTWQQKLARDLSDLPYILAIFLIVYMLLFRVVVVVGPSMYDTLIDGDRLVLLSNVVYTEPKQGDIIVASKKSFEDGECIVKRIIATEGQTVDIDFDAGIVFVDGIAIDEPYTFTPTTLEEGVVFPIVVDEGHVFVLGDNRGSSKDSRNPQIGLIDEREILGKAIFLLYPGTNKGTEDANFDRIGVIG